MQLYESKVVSIVTLVLGTIVLGVLPLLCNRNNFEPTIILSSLLCFGGGVLFSTAMVHMLRELRESIPDYEQYAEIVFCGGFLLLYLIDELVHYFCGDFHKNEKTPEKRTTSYAIEVTESERHPLMMSSGNSKQPPYNPDFFVQNAEEAQTCHMRLNEVRKVGPVVSIGLLVALSIHALLEGLVVGLETSALKVLLLLSAIASHKLVIGFCLGMELASNHLNTPWMHFGCIVIFAFGSALGIIAGMLIYNLPVEFTKFVIPLSQGIAGGTLLYVTVSEVIPRERSRWHQEHRCRLAGLYQFISMAFGFCTMTLLTIHLEYH